MKSKLLKVGVVISIVFAAVLMTGCGSKKASNPLIAKWYYYDGKTTNKTIYYEFKEKGKGGYTFAGETKSFTYKDDGKKVTLSYEGTTAPSEYEYKIEKDTLTIKDSFGNDVVYKK